MPENIYNLHGGAKTFAETKRLTDPGLCHVELCIRQNIKAGWVGWPFTVIVNSVELFTFVAAQHCKISLSRKSTNSETFEGRGRPREGKLSKEF